MDANTTLIIIVVILAILAVIWALLFRKRGKMKIEAGPVKMEIEGENQSPSSQPDVPHDAPPPAPKPDASSGPPPSAPTPDAPSGDPPPAPQPNSQYRLTSMSVS